MAELQVCSALKCEFLAPPPLKTLVPTDRRVVAV
jgi:hypothetical protein